MLSLLQPSDQPRSLGRLAHYEVMEVLGQPVSVPVPSIVTPVPSTKPSRYARAGSTCHDAPFVRDVHDNRLFARFTTDPSSTAYHLHLTDPHATVHLNRGGAIRPECLLCVSLTQPITYAEYDLPPLSYKIVATAIEMKVPCTE